MTERDPKAAARRPLALPSPPEDRDRLRGGARREEHERRRQPPERQEILGTIAQRAQQRFAEHQQILSSGSSSTASLPTRGTTSAPRRSTCGTPSSPIRHEDGARRRGSDHSLQPVRRPVQRRARQGLGPGRRPERGLQDPNVVLREGPDRQASSCSTGPTARPSPPSCPCSWAGWTYSRQPEGALYKFNWIFSDNAERNVFGFHKTKSPRSDGSLAYLDPDEITFKLTCELRDDPLLVFPREERLRILEEAFVRKGHEPRVPETVARGELCQKCQEIYTSLEAYKGNWQKIVRRIQVERFYVSKRYRQSAVVIEPQRNVDAATRPLNLEKSYQIPPILNQSNVHEAFGDLIDANRGVVEYIRLLQASPRGQRFPPSRRARRGRSASPITSPTSTRPCSRPRTKKQAHGFRETPTPRPSRGGSSS